MTSVRKERCKTMDEKMKKMMQEMKEKLTEEQKAKVEECKSLDEFMELAGEWGIELPDDMLDVVSGGDIIWLEWKNCADCGKREHELNMYCRPGDGAEICENCMHKYYG